MAKGVWEGLFGTGEAAEIEEVKGSSGNSDRAVISDGSDGGNLVPGCV